LFIYIRFIGEGFEIKTRSTIKTVIEIAINDIKERRALPCSVIDEHGNVLYNKKELNKAIEEYCLRETIDWEFIYNGKN
jgi:hypothetical protein